MRIQITLKIKTKTKSKSKNKLRKTLPNTKLTASFLSLPLSTPHKSFQTLFMPQFYYILLNKSLILAYISLRTQQLFNIKPEKKKINSFRKRNYNGFYQFRGRPNCSKANTKCNFQYLITKKKTMNYI